ncbi:MAG TPA: hypothetical protein VGR12_05935, partial [Solirubrobacteraceae bacterium]|nr:hypothetical protein [Solirubrobacteraceae bacterium]
DPEHDDTDGDALPDAWEEQYGLDPRAAADADVDVDGDGLLNRAEYRLHSNPRAFDTNHDGRPDGTEDEDAPAVAEPVPPVAEPAEPDAPAEPGSDTAPEITLELPPADAAPEAPATPAAPAGP